MRQSLTSDELPIVNGRIYHLDLAPEELAQDVIIVGDPDRVPFLADEFLVEREVDHFHRGFRSITGIVRKTGMRVSIVSSGIGAPSTEIVLNELAALNEIDFRSMTRKESFEPLNIIRVGTSGGVNPATPLGSLVFTNYVIGLDNTGLYYDVPVPDADCAFLEKQAKMALDKAAGPGVRFHGTIIPYAARADRALLEALGREATELGINYVHGITISSAGFFAEQGRGVARIPSTYPSLVDTMASIEVTLTDQRRLKVENVEMEAGFLLHFLAALGYRAAALCVVINKKKEGVFMTDYRREVLDGARIALRALKRIRQLP